MDLISITLPNEQGCQGDREIGVMDEGRQLTHARIGENRILFSWFMWRYKWKDSNIEGPWKV